MDQLINSALEAGASRAKIIDTGSVVVDERVRLKCAVPLCYGYNACLTCPPYAMDVKDFSQVLVKYSKALIFQVDSSGNSLDKVEGGSLTDIEFFEKEKKKLVKFQVGFQKVLGRIEKIAFKSGHTYAAGFGAGKCPLCGGDCPGLADGICKKPFSARPAMEGVGVDVGATAQRAGLVVELSSAQTMSHTGLVLLY
jgi:predicted metal-binding protein